MLCKRITIQFRASWVLQNRTTYPDIPVSYFAEKLDGRLAEATVESVTALDCVLLWKKRASSEVIAEKVYAAASEILDLPEPKDILTLSVTIVENAEEADDEKSVPPFDPYADAADSEELRMLEQLLQRRAQIRKWQEGGEMEKPSRPQPIGGVVEKVVGMRSKLSHTVKGQMHAIEAFTAGLFAMEVHGSRLRKGKPRAVFLFAGPPGVGKTLLAERAAELLSLPFLRLDMSGFTDDNAAVEAFRGINPSYKAASAGLVTSFVEKNPECVLLLDEIEKAHTHVIQLFLQILEGARCRDAFTEKEVSFENAVIIMTTNAGKRLYENAERRNFSGVSERMVVDALRSDTDPVRGTPIFPAPILSRLGEGTIIMFNYLEPFALCGIVRSEMEKRLSGYRTDFGLNITLDEDIPAAVLYSQGGAADARTLKGAAKSLIDREMLALLQLGKADSIKEVRVDLDLDSASPEVRALFRQSREPRVLLFGISDMCTEGLMATVNPEEAKTLLRGDVDCVIIDVKQGSREMPYRPSDLEDIDSDGVNFFRYTRDYFEELPVYVLADGEGPDAYRSFIRAGAREVILRESLHGRLAEICRSVLTCRAADSLARMRKSLSYNCAQVFSEDGTRAEIKLASMHLRRNVSSEDVPALLADIGKPNVRFADVIGAAEAKETLKDFVEYLKRPREYLAKGLRAPRGVLLYGAPGTGKTLLARALAGESDVAFLHKNATDFFKSYVGEGPKAIREAFRLARKYAPAVLFIDEIDTIGKLRTGSDTLHVMEELQNTFLSEMDGFVRDEKRPVFVLAATNYHVDGEGPRSLDPAFVRRFDRKIEVELPDTAERAQFIEFYLNRHGIHHIQRETIENLALRSIGRSPADLETVIELAVRGMKGKPLTDRALAQALDHDRFGRARVWTEETVQRTSYHEAGHTVVSWFTGGKPTYVTNISRGSHGGYMLPEVDERRFGFTRRELLDRICVALGGRAAEIVVYGAEEGVTTGASGDLTSATATARRLICQYGMDDGRLIALTDEELSGEAGGVVRKRSNELLKLQLERAIHILEEHRDALEALKEALVKRNSLTDKEIAEILENF